MSDKIKNIVVTVTFLLLVMGIFAANLIYPDIDVSVSERRLLSKKPQADAADFLKKEIYKEYENYFLDQFILRDTFRTLKTFGKYNLLHIRDSNGVYLVNGGIYKMEYPLNERSILLAAEKFNQISEKYLKDMNIYYSIIPDKNYFVAEKNGYLALNYERLIHLMVENMDDMTYADIFDLLAIDDYYRTDLHWKQESLLPIAKKLLSSMGKNADSKTIFQLNKLYPFYGSYYGQAALPVKPDMLTYLTNSMTQGAKAYKYRYAPDNPAEPVLKIEIPVYDIELFDTIDPYSLFLAGPEAIVELINPFGAGLGELYIFRDSFADALAPLLLENYSKITLIDIRYADPNLLNMFINFTHGSDVLFLFSTQILNNSVMFN